MSASWEQQSREKHGCIGQSGLSLETKATTHLADDGASAGSNDPGRGRDVERVVAVASGADNVDDPAALPAIPSSWQPTAKLDLDGRLAEDARASGDDGRVELLARQAEGGQEGADLSGRAGEREADDVLKGGCCSRSVERVRRLDELLEQRLKGVGREG